MTPPVPSSPVSTPPASAAVSSALTVLDRLVPAGTRCALIDAPLHSNIGDSAIWLGQRALLDSRGAEVRYACDLMSYDPRQLAACLPDGPILLTGGGNLGDLWEASQLLRERVVRDFPDRRIIQLPQSLHFREQASLARARAVFDGHPDLTLLLRDRHSLRRARSVFDAPALLAPDLAFALPQSALTRGDACHDVVWLAREDKESAGEARDGEDADADVFAFDWTREPDDVAWRAAKEPLLRSRADALRRAGDDDPAGAAAGLLAAYDGLARLQLERGCRLLTAGRAVITDRLHGHVLSLLLGLPHVAVADRYGKVRHYWETWTARSAHDSGAVWAWTNGAAREAAARLSRLTAGPGP